MEEELAPTQSMMSWIQGLGIVPAAALTFAIACTLWLVGRRVFDCFRFREPTVVRDLALLLSGPVIAILVSALKVSVGARLYLRGGIDTDFAFIGILDEVQDICLIGMVSFAMGVCSLMLPAKACDQKKG
ncbi:MAG: hypothetical protein ABJF10_21195 [Chthoniobacter sp.]|uniref:hypothetical protein n=1 Tax=Chthoniobacter sp. TaxID=2510640 RepID=UPI0032A83EB2